MGVLRALFKLAYVANLDGTFTYVGRTLGTVSFFVGVGLWVFTDVSPLVLPAELIVGGVTLFLAPTVWQRTIPNSSRRRI